MFTQLFKTLSTPDRPGGRIGWFRGLCAVFGGFALAYCAMTLVVLLIPGNKTHALFIPFLFFPLAWACAGLWISLSGTGLTALVKSCVPTLLLALAAALLI